jgi:gliding motility-associated-like protein
MKKAFCIAFLFPIVLFGQQKKYPSLLSPQVKLSTAASSPEESEETIEGLVEDVRDRTLNSATFANSKGDIKRVFSAKPIHYDKDGRLERISPYLSPSGQGKWTAPNQPCPTELHPDGRFYINANSTEQFGLGSTLAINGHVSGDWDFLIDSTGMEQYDLIPGVDKQIYFLEGSVKYSYVIHEGYQASPAGFFADELLILPENVDAIPNEMLKDKFGRSTELLLKNRKSGKVIGAVGAPFCYDAEGASQMGYFTLIQNGNQTLLRLQVDASWVNDPARVYPIVIDPLVAGPPSVWNGGNMPSCFIPSFNADSLLVTIPGGISLTNLIVGGSFYADPFTGATMSMGSMYFSTDCGNSTYFTVTGANANIAGTAYLDSFNLLSPLSCCFPKLCTDTSVYVRFHLGRNAFGPGCNTTQIRYDQALTQWPFRVVMYGRTPEAYGSEWYVSQTPICANECTFNATGYARYGVPPYTFTHPWTGEVAVDGTNSGCNSGATNHIFTLTNPNCPIYCDETYTSLSIPPPVITDACGSVVQNIPFKTKPILPAAQALPLYDSIVCNGNVIAVQLNSCLPGGSVSYFGQGISGQDGFTQTIANNSDSVVIVNYNHFTTLGECISDTSELVVYLVPNPVANFSIISNPTVVETPFTLQDQSSSAATILTNWNWYFSDSLLFQGTNVTGTINVPGTIPVCLAVTDNFGCADTICQNLEIVPAQIQNINIITPNGDGVNDALAFDYLDFYPENELYILNRWGNIVYQTVNYQNDWFGSNFSEGTYFYLLKIKETGQEYSSFFQLKKTP